MATDKQKEAARENIKKAQQRWQEMTPRERSLAQPEGRKRAKPGTKGEGDYFRIVVRPKEEFTIFRYHDVGEKGNILRLAGKRSSGLWDTQAWLISKDDAHIEDNTLVADTDDAREVIEVLGSKLKHVKGDVFEARDRPNVPESKKPTEAQRRARTENIQKSPTSSFVTRSEEGQRVSHTTEEAIPTFKRMYMCFESSPDLVYAPLTQPLNKSYTRHGHFIQSFQE